MSQKTREKRAKSPSSATPAPVPPGAAGAAAEKPTESAAKRPRIARMLSADAQQLIINCYYAVQADKSRTGRTARTVAEMMGIAHGTVEKVIKEYKERLNVALRRGAALRRPCARLPTSPRRATATPRSRTGTLTL